MAKKKSVRKAVKKGVKRVSKRAIFGGEGLSKKIKLVLNNFLLFVALSLVSSLFGFVIPLRSEVLLTLFQAMATIFGFVALAFLITLLVLVIMKILKKK